MLCINQSFPSFKMKGVVDVELPNAFADFTDQSFINQWQIYFFWPKDFTFICPTEIVEFNRLYEEFKLRDTQLIGISTDSEFVHLAWRKHQPELKDLQFPLLSDIRRELSEALGIIDADEGVAHRATFIVDPQQIIRFVMVNDLNVGRNPSEVLRVLDALQTDELCPCNWQKGNETLQVA
ncbi:MAG: peroxiredoxin [Gammaproteobacteria bacterium]|nr:peroxiredoxin [Gammaproteobacteria bacterium]